MEPIALRSDYESLYAMCNKVLVSRYAPGVQAASTSLLRYLAVLMPQHREEVLTRLRGLIPTMRTDSVDHRRMLLNSLSAISEIVLCHGNCELLSLSKALEVLYQPSSGGGDEGRGKGRLPKSLRFGEEKKKCE